ncbi:MAG: DUF1178 family protein [Pseudomonadota bacterium]
MIRYDLRCTDCEAEFDAWFASSSAFDEQAEKGYVRCVSCDGTAIEKQIMAPAVRSTRKTSDKSDMVKFAEAARSFIENTHDYVGSDFTAEAKAMHYGEVEHRPIWGEATAEERTELKDEGVDAAPIPAPFVPRKPTDTSKAH